MNVKTRLYASIMAIVGVLFSWVQLFFLNYLMPIGFIAVIVAIINILVCRRIINEKVNKYVLCISGGYIFFEIL